MIILVILTLVVVGVEGWLGFRGTQKTYFHDDKIVISPAKTGIRGSSICLDI